MNGRGWMVVVSAVVLGLAVAWLTRERREARSVSDPEAIASGRAGAPVAAKGATPASNAAPVEAVQQPQPPASDPPQAQATSPIQRDPRGPGYDPARLFRLRGGDAENLYNVEPRDEAFASRREAELKDVGLTAMRIADPKVRLEVECRTAICKVRVYSKKQLLSGAMPFYPLVCLAASSQPYFGPSIADDPTLQDPYSDFYLIFDEETRSTEGMQARISGTCERYREDWLRQAALP